MSPGSNSFGDGSTRTRAIGPGPTVIVACPCTPWIVAMIVARPARHGEMTVASGDVPESGYKPAIAASEVDHLTKRPERAWPAASVAIAVRFSVVPESTIVSAGMTRTAATDARAVSARCVAVVSLHAASAASPIMHSAVRAPSECWRAPRRYSMRSPGSSLVLYKETRGAIENADMSGFSEEGSPLQNPAPLIRILAGLPPRPLFPDCTARRILAASGSPPASTSSS